MSEPSFARADQVDSDIDVRAGLAQIFGEGFTQWLQFFSSDQKTIADAFAHMFVLDQFYVAIADGAVAAMAACTDCKTASVKLNKKILRQHFGLYKGFFAGIFLKREFEAPMQNPPMQTGSIEYVGTSSAFRGRGMASKLLAYIVANTSYRDYLIEEVADTNTPAMNLYRKMGFEVYREKNIAPKRAQKIGINKMLSLKLEKSGDLEKKTP